MKQRVILFAALVVWAAAKGQQGFTILLRVFYEQEAQVHNNQPLLFQVNLTNQNAFEDWKWNRAADERLALLQKDYQRKKISQKQYDLARAQILQTKRQPQTDTIGTPATPWASMVQFAIRRDGDTLTHAWPLRRLLFPQTEAVAVLNETNYYFTEFALRPEDLPSIAAGTYTVTAKLAGAESNPIRVQLTGTPLPDSVLQTEEMLLRYGNFYVQTGKVQKAFAYARQILQLYPNTVDGWVLQGEIRLQQKRYSEALKDFETALKQYSKRYPDLHPPPEYLLGLLAWAKQKAAEQGRQ